MRLLHIAAAVQSGRVLGILSRKTHFLVCSGAAFAASTQKVRKALAMGVPCVHERFIDDCIAAGAVCDPVPFTTMLG